MVNATEIARGIHRISFWDEPDLTGIIFPGASYNLYLIAAQLASLAAQAGDTAGESAEQAAKKLHLDAFEVYRPDNNARDRAHQLHREKNPAANRAAQSIVLYTLGAAP